MAEQQIRVIITGATGMVGEGVLHECLQNPEVKAVLMVNRKPLAIQHEKLKQLIIPDLLNLKVFEPNLTGYNACFFCLGVSSVGLDWETYYSITHDLTLNFAETLVKLNPEMTFCYVSGGGTDSSEKGRSAWARVKGKTENDLMKLPFKSVYAFRPGFIKPTPGLKHAHNYYRYIGWLYSVGKLIYPQGFNKLCEVGGAMIAVADGSEPRNILRGTDISRLAK